MCKLKTPGFTFRYGFATLPGMCSRSFVLFCFLFGGPVCAMSATEPPIRIVFPAEGARLAYTDRVFVIGAVRPADVPLTLDERPITPHRTGGFLHMAPVSPGTNTLIFNAGGTVIRHTFRIDPPPQSWDGCSLRAQAPLQPLGLCTGETVRLACLAPADRTVFAAVGERTLALVPQPGHATLYVAKLAFDVPVADVPVTFFATGLLDAAAAPLTARADWPALRTTGPLFAMRARSEPGGGETVAFLPPDLTVRGAGFVGAHTRFWLAGERRFMESRHLTSLAPEHPLPPCDLPIPDLTAGFTLNPPVGRAPDSILIVLDPGHGGASTGAVGPTGLTEKEANLIQAHRVAATLRKAGFRVLLTREDDKDLDLYARVRLAYERKADAFISIHYNSCGPAGNPSESRHIATYAWNAIGLRLARALHPHLAAASPAADGGVRTASFAVCRNPVVPACLLELDFITCPLGEESLQQPDQRERVAHAVLAGLRNWLTPSPRTESANNATPNKE